MRDRHVAAIHAAAQSPVPSAPGAGHAQRPFSQSTPCHVHSSRTDVDAPLPCALARTGAAHAHHAESRTPAPVVSEAKLLRALRAGEAQGYEQLVRLHGARMLVVARRVLRHEDDAEDCVQDAFIKALSALNAFQGKAALGSWLHRIVLNTAIGKLRARNRRHETVLDNAASRHRQATGNFVETGTHVDISPQTLLEQQETRWLVRHAIAQLPDRYRYVLMSRDMEGYDTLETATRLGLTAGAVKTRLHRARAALRIVVEPMFQGERA